MLKQSVNRRDRPDYTGSRVVAFSLQQMIVVMWNLSHFIQSLHRGAKTDTKNKQKKNSGRNTCSKYKEADSSNLVCLSRRAKPVLLLLGPHRRSSAASSCCKPLSWRQNQTCLLSGMLWAWATADATLTLQRSEHWTQARHFKGVFGNSFKMCPIM